MSAVNAPWTSLIAAREAAGMSRYRLAQEMHINLSHLGRLERGEASPRADTVRRAAEALGVTVEQATPAKEDAALVVTEDRLRQLIIASLKEVCTEREEGAPKELWGVYLNTDMTEGRGMRYLARLFRTEEKARAWGDTQDDYHGHPMHVVKETELDLAALDSFEGMRVPR